MNTLDIAVLIVLALGAWRGFRNGLVIEVCSLLAFALGIWAALRHGADVGKWLDLDPDQSALAFILTLFVVIVLVRLMGWAFTKVIDLAALGLPNKLAGLAFGTARMALLVSLVLTCLPITAGKHTIPAVKTCEGSVLYDPLRTMAGTVLPALRDSPWVKRTIERVKEEIDPVVR